MRRSGPTGWQESRTANWMSSTGTVIKLVVLALTGVLFIAPLAGNSTGLVAESKTAPDIGMTVMPPAWVRAQATASPTASPTTSPPHVAANPLTHGLRSGHEVALTFDADMTPFMLHELKIGLVRSWYDPRIEQILDRQNVPATIFLTGLWTKAYPAQARHLASDPLLEIGNHSYDHAAFRVPCYGLAPAVDKKLEIELAQRTIQQVTGLEPKLFRFPGDCYGKPDTLLVQQLGLTAISGDVKGADAFNPYPASVIAIVLKHIQAGSIVILHLQGGPNAPATSAALAPIITAARARGLVFVKVSKLLAELVQPTFGKEFQKVRRGWTGTQPIQGASAAPRRRF
jgi:peptidoglycan-N-acetylglucosamine deacetylase